jgi:hypothetical protein
MKKLLGVMILAGLPVACGTTNPNAPELPAAGAAAGETSFEASGRTSTAPARCTPVQSVVVSVTERRRGMAFLNAQALGAASPSGSMPVFCGIPTWSVTPEGRGVRLSNGLSSGGTQSAVLDAPAGTYVVTLSYLGALSGASGSTTVTFR